MAQTAGLNVVGQTTQKLNAPNPKTFIGSGKVDEVKALTSETLAEVILFDDELSPRHQRELEKIFGDDIRVLDRTALILDIFAQHASTREGSLQVELAQYEYRLPRLTRAWTHLARQAGGGGGRSGSVGGWVYVVLEKLSLRWIVAIFVAGLIILKPSWKKCVPIVNGTEPGGSDHESP